MVEGILALVILIADIWAIYNVVMSGASTGAKIIWSLAIFFLPVLGFIAWLVAGPRATG